MLATCTVASSQRCDAPTDGPHSVVRFACARWWRWLPMGGWVTSARVEAPLPRVGPPTLASLAASVGAGDRWDALRRIGVPR